MTITTIPSREFNQGVAQAKKAADKGPVFITDRGRPAYVLLTMEEQGLMKQRRSIADSLAMPGKENVELELQRLTIETRQADFS